MSEDIGMEIIEFLEARIAEDEAAARNASPGPWSYSDIDSIGGGTIYDPTVAIAGIQWDNEAVGQRIRRIRPRWQADATGVHIARHNPARVLAECAAKRAVIDAHRRQDEDDDPMAWIVASEILLHTLAAVYADHKDYDPDWK